MRSWWWSQQQWCSARIGGASSGVIRRSQRLTHSCRTFHDPQPRRPSNNGFQRLQHTNTIVRSQFHPAAILTKTRSYSRTDTTFLHLSSRSLTVRPRLAARAATASTTPLRRFYSHSTMAQVKWPAAEVRKTFFNYFEEKGHTLGMLHSASDSSEDRCVDPAIALQSHLVPPFLTMTPPCSSPMRA